MVMSGAGMEFPRIYIHNHLCDGSKKTLISIQKLNFISRTYSVVWSRVVQDERRTYLVNLSCCPCCLKRLMYIRVYGDTGS